MAQEINVRINGRGPYGFRIKGGTEFNVPISVTQVTKNGKAELAGIRKDMKILTVNGVNVHKLTHAEVVDLIKNAFSLDISLVNAERSNDNQLNGSNTSNRRNFTENSIDSFVSNGKAGTEPPPMQSDFCQISQTSEFQPTPKSIWYKNFIQKITKATPVYPRPTNNKINQQQTAPISKMYETRRNIITEKTETETDNKYEKIQTGRFNNEYSLKKSPEPVSDSSILHCNSSSSQDAYSMFRGMDSSVTELKQNINRNIKTTAAFAPNSFAQSMMDPKKTLTQFEILPDRFMDTDTRLTYSPPKVKERQTLKLDSQNNFNFDEKYSAVSPKKSELSWHSSESTISSNLVSKQLGHKNPSTRPKKYEGTIKCFSKNNSESDTEPFSFLDKESTGDQSYEKPPPYKYLNGFFNDLNDQLINETKIEKEETSTSRNLSVSYQEKDEDSQSDSTGSNEIAMPLSREKLKEKLNRTVIERLKEKKIFKSELSQENKAEKNGTSHTAAQHSNGGSNFTNVAQYCKGLQKQKQQNNEVEDREYLSPTDANNLCIFESRDDFECNIEPDKGSLLNVHSQKFEVAPFFAVATQNSNADHPKQINLSKGSIVHVLRNVDDRFYEVEFKGVFGLVPKRNLKSLNNNINTSKPYNRQVIGVGVTTCNFFSSSSIVLSFYKDDYIIVNTILDGNWFEATLNNIRGIILRKNVQFVEAVYTNLYDVDLFINEDLDSKEPQSSNSDDENNSACFRKKGNNLTMFTCEVNQEYTPASDDEILIQNGDIIYVQRFYSDGWGLGYNTRSLKTGMFPVFFSDLQINDG